MGIVWSKDQAHICQQFNEQYIQLYCNCTLRTLGLVFGCAISKP